MLRKTLLTGTIIALLIAFMTSSGHINTGLHLVITTNVVGFDVLRMLGVISLFMLLISPHPPRPLSIRWGLGIVSMISMTAAISMMLSNSIYFFDIVTMMLVSSIAMIDAIEQAPEKIHLTPSKVES